MGAEGATEAGGGLSGVLGPRERTAGQGEGKAAGGFPGKGMLCPGAQMPQRHIGCVSASNLSGPALGTVIIS